MAAQLGVAAVLYGVGVKLDASPELFFKLRKVDHRELIGAAGERARVWRGQTEFSRIGIGLSLP